MKRMVVAVLVLMILGASNAGAVDINGKWGIGAGVFTRGGEISLIRGRSERSAWLFDVSVLLRDDVARIEVTPPYPSGGPTTNDNAISIVAGPGYRRFTRPDDDLSPYWDVALLGTVNREHRGGTGASTRTSAGVQGNLSFGIEYFTRWHFSVAAHSSLVRLSWAHMSTRESGLGGAEYRSTGHGTEAAIGLSPSLFVRGYF